MWPWVEETVGNRGKVVQVAEIGWKQIKGGWTLQDSQNIISQFITFVYVSL